MWDMRFSRENRQLGARLNLANKAYLNYKRAYWCWSIAYRQALKLLSSKTMRSYNSRYLKIKKMLNAPPKQLL